MPLYFRLYGSLLINIILQRTGDTDRATDIERTNAFPTGPIPQFTADEDEDELELNFAHFQMNLDRVVGLWAIAFMMNLDQFVEQTRMTTRKGDEMSLSVV